MKSINVNQNVKVLLSKNARERLEESYKELARVLNEDYKVYQIYDEDGYYHTQLWKLMRGFGDMFRGCDSPIIDCKIILEGDLI